MATTGVPAPTELTIWKKLGLHHMVAAVVAMMAKATAKLPPLSMVLFGTIAKSTV